MIRRWNLLSVWPIFRGEMLVSGALDSRFGPEKYQYLFCLGISQSFAPFLAPFCCVSGLYIWPWIKPPLFRSGLVPSVADNFRKCFSGTNVQPWIKTNLFVGNTFLFFSVFCLLGGGRARRYFYMENHGKHKHMFIKKRISGCRMGPEWLRNTQPTHKWHRTVFVRN